MDIMEKYMKYTVRRIDKKTGSVLEKVHTANDNIAERIRAGYDAIEGSYGEIVDYQPHDTNVNVDLLEALMDFACASANLEKALSEASEKDLELITDSYPFRKPFKELERNIAEWMDRIQEKLDR